MSDAIFTEILQQLSKLANHSITATRFSTDRSMADLRIKLDTSQPMADRDQRFRALMSGITQVMDVLKEVSNRSGFYVSLVTDAEFSATRGNIFISRELNPGHVYNDKMAQTVLDTLKEIAAERTPSGKAAADSLAITEGPARDSAVKTPGQ